MITSEPKKSLVSRMRDWRLLLQAKIAELESYNLDTAALKAKLAARPPDDDEEPLAACAPVYIVNK